MEKEIWKDVQGYEGLYQVSNLGRVKSLNYHNTKEERVLKQNMVRDYYQVCFSVNKKRKYYRVNRLVATAFIPNPNNYQFVNHINEVKTDNRVDNLEWCDVKYNINYGSRNERISISSKGKVLSQETKDKIAKAKRDKKTLNRMKTIFIKLLELRRQVS